MINFEIISQYINIIDLKKITYFKLKFVKKIKKFKNKNSFVN